MTDPAVLLKAASDFRWAVEETAPFSGQFAALRGFPGGCCKQASFLLARLLAQECAVEGIEYVWGTAMDGVRGTHGWLECHGYVLDVTADQFPGVENPVIVATREYSAFHDGFGRGPRDSYPRFWQGMKSQVRADFDETFRSLLLRIRKKQF